MKHWMLFLAVFVIFIIAKFMNWSHWIPTSAILGLIGFYLIGFVIGFIKRKRQ